MELIKKYYKRILLILFALLFCNMCVKNCSKSNNIRMIEHELDSITKIEYVLVDSINKLNGIIINKNIELEGKNTQIEQLSKTLSTIVNKNSINNIRVIIPEAKKETETRTE